MYVRLWQFPCLALTYMRVSWYTWGWQSLCESWGSFDIYEGVLTQLRDRAPENLKLAGNWPKMAAMCGLQDYQKSHICVVFKLIIPITVVFMHFFWPFRPIWLAISIFGSTFWLEGVLTYMREPWHRWWSSDLPEGVMTYMREPSPWYGNPDIDEESLTNSKQSTYPNSLFPAFQFIGVATNWLKLNWGTGVSCQTW